ncbi:MAG TPA: uroporphyrinogen-III synthase [Amaricoccus sp.]|uniref:uroporphyrinogen-III synthase n=1 Tax=Amaricoccus sp. TaxID=1872485 RepID=UPI002B611D27|nr:uroporphyrinogen-III synthase [Amaricoccus sp.]HMQ95013.1 uroporphyrinogen-III synthase [Amaricoccus sp.]HMR50887.1 uroporphyrinogen-III synthase [Amaricoccus sp.]HMR61659.1 uroporphyrinogen-III synthase [Amaricoccus sp.]HMT97934.1 uroporphyrinogen-III synthase [Amaricoccus sp.]
MPQRRTLLLTRPEAQSAEFAAALEVALPGRFRVVAAPMIEIVALPGTPDLVGVGGLLFTSANGVAQFADRIARRDLPAYCVGAMTAAAARAAGFEAASAGGDVAALAALVAARRRPGGGALLHVRGRHAAGDLAGRLAAAGFEVRAAEIYDQRQRVPGDEALALLQGAGAEAVAVFSPRSARILAQAARDGGWHLAGTTSVALSAAADAGLGEAGFARRMVAATPTREGMIAALAEI